jgi:hypothetical protein
MLLISGITLAGLDVEPSVITDFRGRWHLLAHQRKFVSVPQGDRWRRSPGRSQWQRAAEGTASGVSRRLRAAGGASGVFLSG